MLELIFLLLFVVAVDDAKDECEPTCTEQPWCHCGCPSPCWDK